MKAVGDNPEAMRAWLKAPENQTVLASVTQLTLNKKELAVIPREIEVLTELTYLALAENQIEEIPAGVFAKCNKLKTLHLFKNHIKKINKEAFAGLNQLEALIWRGT